MWTAIFFVLLAGAASAEHFHAWKTDTEYEYLVRGRTLAGLHDFVDQYTGMIYKAILTVHPKSEDTLQAKVSKAQYAQIHTKLPDGWKSEIPEKMVEYKQLPMSEKVFEIKMKHGVVRDLLVDKDVPTWEVNMLKSIVSQMQVDTQGENLMPSKYNQEPEEDTVNAMYKTMEDSVGGRCEVLYDISQLPEHNIWNKQEWAIKSDYRDEKEEMIDIVKTKNYTNCEQRMSLHFGITEPKNSELFSMENGKFMSRSAISRILITGNLKTFTIHSSVTTDKVILNPNAHDSDRGMVGSKVNMTLVKMGPPSSGPWSTPANTESTGNLVYSYNNPFAGPGEDRRPGMSTMNSDTHSEERLRFADYKSGEDDSSASRSSKGIDSLESNEEQKSYWQTKPTLNEAPETPFLPFFIGNNGKSIQKSTDIDTVGEVKTLASQIGSDLQNPSNIAEEDTLEKFTILTRILRTMNTKQIAEAERDLYQSSNEIDPHDESQSVRRNTWAAFRDAVAQAGTGPALVTIKNWIKEKKVKGLEAATVVAVLSKTARTPTPEYMDAFFEMATMPETTSQHFLNTTAMITFAELIRYSQVNHASAHNRYPVHSFGRLSPKHNPAVFRDYVPHMAEELKKAIDNDEPAKSHVFIRALGAVAHPKILAVFEPYLEGTIKASTFQRLLMVMSMNELASLRPRLVRGVLYRIYQNTAEAHQLRCAAVTFLMATNPPASMLHRMAEFTNYDHSKQVNAAVKSSIESASELESPENQDLATKARNVLSLLNKEVYGFEYSRNYLIDYIVDIMSFTSDIHLAHIGSAESVVPEAIYASIEGAYGGFRIPKIEIGAMVSSFKELYNMWKLMVYAPPGDKSDNSHISPEKIAKELKFDNVKGSHLEAVMWMNNIYNNKFFSLDKHMMKRVPELIMDTLDSLKNGKSFSMAKIHSYDVTISFPMESSLPFLYTLNTPTLTKLAGSVKAQSDKGSLSGMLETSVTHASQLQSRFGFVAPFEHQHYVVGVHRNSQLYLPIRTKVDYNHLDQRLTVKLEPINQSEKYKIVESSITPFTSRHDILSMSPVMKDKETHMVLTEEVWKSENKTSSETNGRNIEVIWEGELAALYDSDDMFWTPSIMKYLPVEFAKDKINYNKLEMFLGPNQSKSQSIVFTVAYESLKDDTTDLKSKKDEKLHAKAPLVKSKKMNDPERRKQLLKEVVKGIMAAEAFAVDFAIELPGQENLAFFTTLAYANSKVDPKSQASIFMKETRGDDGGEVCIGLESLSPKASLFDLERTGNVKLAARKFDMEVRGGTTCEDGGSVRIHGNQTTSTDYLDIVKDDKALSKCIEEMEKGTKSLAACQELGAMLSFMNEANVNITFDSNALPAMRVMNQIIQEGGNNLDNVLLYNRPNEDIDKDTIVCSMYLDPSVKTAMFRYESPEMTSLIKDVELGPLASIIGMVNPDLSFSESMNLKLMEADVYQHTCTIDSNVATTFDHKVYPLNLGKCWHVAMTSHPKDLKDKTQDEKDTIQADRELTVLVRDAGDKKKDVKFGFGDKEVELTETDGKLRATVNGKEVHFGDKPFFKEMNGKATEFEILLRPDGALKILSAIYELDAVYDGQYVRMKASDKYRNDVRGLCGNYDGEPDNDFLGPKNCVLKETDAFVTSYALTSKDCEGPALEASKKVDKATCYHDVIKPGNVISDREAGRTDPKKSNWGYHSKEDSQKKHNEAEHKRCTMVKTKVIEEEDQICFSMRPLPMCAPGCKASRTKPKVMPMHCMPKDEAAKGMAERIKQGANPDLSQKAYSKKSGFDLPVSCHAA